MGFDKILKTGDSLVYFVIFFVVKIEKTLWFLSCFFELETFFGKNNYLKKVYFIYELVSSLVFTLGKFTATSSVQTPAKDI